MKNLFKRQAYTDFETGELIVCTPIKKSGRPDKSRETLFIGQSNVALFFDVPDFVFQFDIKADTLEQAVDSFDKIAKEAAATTIERIQEEHKKGLEEQAKNKKKIVVPGKGGIITP